MNVLRFGKSGAAAAGVRAPAADELPATRGRMILFSAACMILAASAAGTLFVSHAREDRLKAQVEMQRAARAGVELIEQRVAVAEAILKGLSVSPALLSGDLAAFYLQAKAAAPGQGISIVVMNPDYSGMGDMLLNTRRPFGEPLLAIPPSPAAHDFVASVAGTRSTQISDVGFSQVSNRYIVGVAIPVLRDDKVVYVLAMVFPEVELTPSFIELTEPAWWQTGVVDRVGMLLPGRDSGEAPSAHPPFDFSRVRASAADGATEGMGSDRVPLYVAYSRSNLTGWTVFVAGPKRMLDAPVNRAFLLLIVGGVFLVLAGVGIAYLAGPGVILPLRRRIVEDEERFRAMANTVPSILFTTDQDGACDYANERFYAYTGLSAGAAEGFGWAAAIHPEDRAKIFNMLAARTDAGSPVDLEARLRGQDGTYRWFMSKTTAVTDAAGRVVKRFGAATDIDDRKRSEAALRGLSLQLMKSQDDERRRIAREIHDTTVQNLVAAKFQVDQVHAGALPAAALEETRDLLDLSLQELRTLTYLLHPPLLEELGLASAVRWYAQGFEKRGGIGVTVDAPDRLPRLSTEVESTLFRVVQEGLANVHRHSGSSRARVSLQTRADEFVMEIADSGKGMSEAALSPAAPEGAVLGVGIPGMRLRLQQIGGKLDIKSGRGGTRVTASVPLAEAGAKPATVTRIWTAAAARPAVNSSSSSPSEPTPRALP